MRDEDSLWRQLGEVSAMAAGVSRMIDEFERVGRPTATGRELLANLETVQERYKALIEQVGKTS
jgi:hypothetical protein